MKFEVGDRVKLYNWKDAHAAWSKFGPAPARGEIIGIPQDVWDKFRSDERLTIRFVDNAEPPVYLVEGTTPHSYPLSFYIPGACLYKDRRN